MSAPSSNCPKYRYRAKSGFILLEVLVAMSLVLGAWMTLIQSYQSLSLKLAQQDSQRAQIRKEQNDFESDLMAMDLSNEPARMLNRTHLMRTTSQSASPSQR